MPMFRPRTRRMARASILARSPVPARWMAPLTMVPCAPRSCMTARAVTDFPEPLSPTMPTISPGAIEKETSRRTSRRPPSPSKATVRFSMASRISAIASASVQAGIEDVPKPVAEDVEADDRDPERKAPEERERGVCAQDRQAVANHAAPARVRLLDAEPEKAQRRLRHDDEADADRGAHQDRRDDVRQQVAVEDLPSRRAGDDRRIDEEFFPQDEDERARQPRDARPPDEGEGDD